MKKLILTVAGNSFFNADILIDDNYIYPIKKKKGIKTYEIETDKNELEIKINTLNELNSKHWLAIHIFFFIVSLFGIFDIKDKKKNYSINYKGKLKLIDEEPNIKIIFKSCKVNEPAFRIEGNCELENNDSNKYFIDEEIAEKKKILKTIKIVSWILLVIILITIFILKII